MVGVNKGDHSQFHNVSRTEGSLNPHTRNHPHVRTHIHMPTHTHSLAATKHRGKHHHTHTPAPAPAPAPASGLPRSWKEAWVSSASKARMSTVDSSSTADDPAAAACAAAVGAVDVDEDRKAESAATEAATRASVAAPMSTAWDGYSAAATQNRSGRREGTVATTNTGLNWFTITVITWDVAYCS